MDRRLFALVLSIMVVLLLAGCSAVFEAGISGKVVTKSSGGSSDVAVEDVNVFAYTDKSLRDSDFEKFVNKTITRPNESSGYVSCSRTTERGEFVVNKIVWETKNSKFGKTADVNKLYLIFYHKDYDPQKYDATIISGSTNADNVYVTLTKNKDYATLTVNVMNVASGRAMTDACTLEYTIEGRSETVHVAEGLATLNVYFDKGTSPDMTFKLTSPGTNWKMSHKNGTKFAEEEVETVEHIEKGTRRVDLYMKNYEVILPAFSGSVILGSGSDYSHVAVDDPSHNKNDDVKVWLEYKPASGGDYVPFTEVEDAKHETTVREEPFGTSVRYYHGEFSGVGSDGYSVVINNDEDNPYRSAVDWNAYDEKKTITLKLRIVFGDGSKYKEYEYMVNGSANLGTIDLSE